MNNLDSQRGQVALIILLIMVVVLTIGISIASRTVMDVSLSRQEDQSGRVYQGAESGVESALSQDLTNDSLYTNDAFSGSLSNLTNLDVDYTVSRQKTLETQLDQGSSVAVDLTGVVNGNQLQIQWGQGRDCSNSDPSQNVPSILINVLNNTAGTITQRTFGYAACTYTDGYTTSGTTAGSNGYYRSVTMTMQTGDSILRITPMYNDAPIQVSGVGWTLPTQYYAIRSTAKNQLGNETKVIQVARTLPTYPTVMDYVLYSGTTIVK
jgi:Tfp pilus assembly protein PilX